MHDKAAATSNPPVMTPSSGVALSTSASYDAASGVQLTATGLNGERTIYNQYDPLLRPTSVTLPNTGTLTASYYPASYTINQTLSSSGSTATTVVLLDGYGRNSRDAVLNGQSPNYWYQVDNCYDATGLLQFVPVAYQSTGFNASIRCSGAGTTNTYDAIGRVQQVTTGDGTATTQYNGRAAETTDVNGVKKITQYDLLGRISSVCEISGSNNLPGSGATGSCGSDLGGTGFLTAYSYTPANPTTITQGAQVRTFTTDLAGRATAAVEPEQGVTTYGYSYNGTGLVLTRVRPQANQTNASATTTTTTQFDSVGRPINVGYSDGTPTKTFLYDTPNWAEASSMYNLKGRLSLAYRTTSAGGAGTAFSYDAAGNVITNYICLPSGCGNAAYDRTIAYGYDLGGNLTSESDGAGVTYSYTRSPAGELTGMTSSLANASSPGNVIVPGSVQNTPFGPTSYGLGNGLNGVIYYDSMGRHAGNWVCSGTTAVGCSSGGTTYGNVVTFSGSQVKYLDDTALGQKSNIGYDEFNRMTSLTPASGSVVNLGGYTYTYDRWGIRWGQTVTAGSGPSPQYSYNTSNNQLNHHSYDAAGNVMNDGSHSYTYDADGNLTADGPSPTNLSTQYAFDALNRRVRINRAGDSGVLETAFDQFGKRASIWNASNETLAEALAYWDGKPVAIRSQGSLHFEHQDYLGTERVRTGPTGSTETVMTSTPFADKFSSSGPVYDLHYFAGTEYDYESYTDHAQYRQYAASSGRWMSPDPYFGSYDVTNPQSLNRYSYVLNSPLSGIDPNGLATQIVCVNNPTYHPTQTSTDSDGGITVTGDGYWTNSYTCTTVTTPDSPVQPTQPTNSSSSAPNNGTPQTVIVPLLPDPGHKQQQTRLNQKCAVAAAASATLATTSALNAGAAVITAPAVVPGLIFGGTAAVEGVGAGLFGIYAAYACYQAAQF